MALQDKLQNMQDEQFVDQRANFVAQSAMIALKREMESKLPELIKAAVKEHIDGLNIHDGIDGITPIKDKDYFDGKDGSPDTPKEIKEKLETLKGEARLDASAIKNLPRLIETKSKGGAKGGGGNKIRVENLSSQANGSTRTFTLVNRPTDTHVLLYSSFPSVFVATTDYSIAGTTLTLGSNINPPVAGQSLVLVYESSD